MPAKLNSDGRDHYALLPDSVLFDRSLTGSAVCVYAFLSGSRLKDSRSVSVGIRLIASELELDKNTVQSALKILIKNGHLKEPESKKSTRRGSYYLTSSAFSRSPRKHESKPRMRYLGNYEWEGE